MKKFTVDLCAAWVLTVRHQDPINQVKPLVVFMASVISMVIFKTESETVTTVNMAAAMIMFVDAIGTMK